MHPGEPIPHLELAATAEQLRDEGPIGMLAEVFAALKEGRPASAAASDWFTSGAIRAIKRGDTLDASLGLSAPGRRSLQGRLLAIERDAHLLDAIRAVALGDEVTTWQRCRRLAPQVKAFMGNAWPREKRLAAPPADWPAWKRSVFLAAATDLRIPTSARGLLDIAQRTGGVSARGARARLLARYL